MKGRREKEDGGEKDKKHKPWRRGRRRSAGITEGNYKRGNTGSSSKCIGTRRMVGPWSTRVWPAWGTNGTVGPNGRCEDSRKAKFPYSHPPKEGGQRG